MISQEPKGKLTETPIAFAWWLSCSHFYFFFHFVRNNRWISQNKVDLHREPGPLWDLQKLSLGKLRDKLAITWILLFAGMSQHFLIVSSIKSRRHSEFLLSDTEEVGEVWQPVKYYALWIRKKYCFCGFYTMCLVAKITSKRTKIKVGSNR